MIVLERSQSIFEGFVNAGTATKSWFAIFSLLQRLRQACDHVSLTVGKMTESIELTHFKCEDERAKVEQPLNGDAEGMVNDNVSTNLNSIFYSQVSTYSLSDCLSVPAKFIDEIQGELKWSLCTSK